MDKRYKGKLRERQASGKCSRCRKPKWLASSVEDADGKLRWLCRECVDATWAELMSAGALFASEEAARKALEAKRLRVRRKKLTRWAEKRGLDAALVLAVPDADLLAMQKDALRLSKEQVAAAQRVQAKHSKKLGERRSVKLSTEGNVPLVRRLLAEGKGPKAIFKAVLALYRSKGNTKPDAWIQTRVTIYIKIAQGKRKGAGM